MKVIYAGTPDFAVPALAAIITAGHDVVAVYTQPDRPAGRGRKPRPSPVKELALKHKLPVCQPISLKGEAEQAELAALQADIMVVAAYGLILPQSVLDMPRLGCINLHASILPRWRGAAPIQRAILAGDKQSGVTLMQMEAGLDTGPMLVIKTVPIKTTTTGADLHDQLSELGAEMIGPGLASLSKGTLTATAQPEAGVTYAKKLSKEEAKIDWTQPAEQITRAVHAFNAWPVSYCLWKEQPLRIWNATAIQGHGQPGAVTNTSSDGIDVGTGDGLLRITRLQRAGKKQQSCAEFLNGVDLNGEHFE